MGLLQLVADGVLLNPLPPPSKPASAPFAAV
jgi:hypothetical protein